MTDVAAPPLPWSYRPLGVRVMFTFLAVVLLGVVGFVWLALPASVRATFTPLQTVTLLIMLAFALSVIYGFMRCRVLATESGVDLVNFFTSRHLQWAQILQVNLKRGAPWAVLDLDDGTTVIALALQGSDGQRAQRGVAELRALVESRTRTNRND